MKRKNINPSMFILFLMSKRNANCFETETGDHDASKKKKKKKEMLTVLRLKLVIMMQAKKKKRKKEKWINKKRLCLINVKVMLIIT